MVHATVAAPVRCPCCGSQTPFEDRCQWCAKPVAVAPRPPTDDERLRLNSPHHNKRRLGRVVVEKRLNGSLAANLLSEIDVFLRRHRMPQTKFGRLVGQYDIVENLRSGFRVHWRTAVKVRTFMADYTP